MSPGLSVTKSCCTSFRISDELIRDWNQGTGAVSCGVSIATGIIIYGSVSGSGGTIWTATGFWALGQIILIIAVMIYNWITPYNVHDEIEKDNVAAGVSLGGAIIGIGIIVGLAAEGDFESWSESLPDFFPGILYGTAASAGYPVSNRQDSVSDSPADRRNCQSGSAQCRCFVY